MREQNRKLLKLRHLGGRDYCYTVTHLHCNTHLGGRDPYCG